MAYMEDYLAPFHQMRDISLQLWLSKSTIPKIDEEQRMLLRQRVQINERVASSKRPWVRDENRDEESDRRMNPIYRESPSNFIKIYLPSRFVDQIHSFVNIRMYASEYGELAHNEDIKDNWSGSYKKNMTRQSLHI